jgi:DNA topoisomerase-1
MDIKFTADFEEYLDKIAEGKAKWVNILNQFYQKFNPMCESLLKDVKENKTLANKDKSLGIDPDTNLEIFIGVGQYGPFVKRLEEVGATKWKYASIKDDPDEIDLDEAIKLLKFPILLGKIGKAHVTLNKGQFGLYLKYGDKNISVNGKNEDEIDLTVAKQLIETGGGDKYAIKTFTVKNKVINVKKGEYGPYLQIVSGTKKSNIPLPKSYTPEELSLEDVLSVIAEKNGTEKITNKKEKNI